MNIIQQLEAQIHQQLPEATTRLDSLVLTFGAWYLEVWHQRKSVVVEWRPSTQVFLLHISEIPEEDREYDEAYTSSHKVLERVLDLLTSPKKGQCE